MNSRTITCPSWITPFFDPDFFIYLCLGTIATLPFGLYISGVFFVTINKVLSFSFVFSISEDFDETEKATLNAKDVQSETNSTQIADETRWLFCSFLASRTIINRQQISDHYFGRGCHRREN
jgi:hypothetical protein